jgi:hypothetical protein
MAATVCSFCAFLQSSGFHSSVAKDPGLLCYNAITGLMFRDIVKKFSTFIFNPQCLEVKAMPSLKCEERRAQ